MHRVLIPVDGSETALRAAKRYAELAPQLKKTEVLLLNVQNMVAMKERFVNGRPSEVEHLQAPLREAAEKLFAATRKVLDEAGIAHTDHVEFGDTATTIADFAQKYHCDHIVMGTHGLGAIAQMVLGSVASKVLHLAAIPVMLVK
jgi:nucleotide-binding universal stress UspA family protein